MKVLFLTHRLPYAPNRGDRIRSYYLLREMSRFADVSVFSLIHDADEAAHVGSVPFAQRVTGLRAPRVRNLFNGAIRMATRRPLTHSLLDAPGAERALAAMVADDPPDVVVALCSSMARFALAPPLADRAFVLDMVDVDSGKWADMAIHARGPLRWVYRREATTLQAFEAVATKAARVTFVVNEREHDLLQQIAPSARVVVVPLGVELEEFAPATPPSDQAQVVFCGVLNYGPNEDGVIWFVQHVWPRVRAARPDATFAIVGLGPTKRLRQAVAGDRSITVVGEVPTVQPHLWASALSIAPIHVARGLQTKVLEALAAGLPVVVTPPVWEGLPGEVRPGCAPAASPAEFADAVVRLLQLSPDTRRKRAATADLHALAWADRLAAVEPLLREAAAAGREAAAPHVAAGAAPQ